MTSPFAHAIITLHQFFQDWFLATLPQTDDAFAPLGQSLAPNFHLITPSGHIIPRATLLTNLYQAHGQWHTNPQQIWIEQIQTHVHNPPVTLLTYQEWQGTPAQSRGRLSTALLSQPAPNQPILWHHVHETWLPT